MIHKILLILIIFNLYNKVMASNPIEVRADEWCPYNCDPKEDRKGYLIDILIKAFGEENINYETMNWARAISETKKGTYNAIIGATKDEGRDFIFSQPLGINQNCFYSNKNVNLKYAGIDSLKSIKLGIVKDYSYYPELNKYIKLNIENKNLIDESYGDFVLQKLVKKIQNHDIDAFVEDQNVVNYYLKINTYIDFLKKFGCHKFEYIYIAFSPKKPDSKEKVEILNKKISNMMKNGEMKKLLKQYGIPIWYK